MFATTVSGNARMCAPTGVGKIHSSVESRSAPNIDVAVAGFNGRADSAVPKGSDGTNQGVRLERTDILAVRLPVVVHLASDLCGFSSGAEVHAHVDSWLALHDFGTIDDCWQDSNACL